ncbi:hypothetical protein DRP53_10290, partial [candidate division WOR-3 bacterium]
MTIFILTNLLLGMLVPTPFMTDPEVVQRAGSDLMYKYFKQKVIDDCYGLASFQVRDIPHFARLIFMTDPGWHRVVYAFFEEETRQEAKWLKGYGGGIGSSDDRFNSPRGLAVDTSIYNGIRDQYNIYIADKRNDRVMILRYKHSEEEAVFGGKLTAPFIDLDRPTDVACISTSLARSLIVIVSQQGCFITVLKTDPHGNFEYLLKYGTPGPLSGQFRYPTGVAITKANDVTGGYYIYVTDLGNKRIVCLRYKDDAITWEREYKAVGDSKFISVACDGNGNVYVTDRTQDRILVFKPGLTEILYIYADPDQLNGPNYIYVEGDQVGLTEGWTAKTGLQYFRIVYGITDLEVVPERFDATKAHPEGTVKIKFRIEHHYQKITLVVAGRKLIDDELYPPGDHFVFWDGKDADGKVVLPGVYTVEAFVRKDGELVLSATAEVTVKGVVINKHIDYNRRLVKYDEPYVITGEIKLEAGKTLEIEPGVRVMFASGANLLVFGTMTAVGNYHDSINFLPHKKETDPLTPGYWGNLSFYSGSDESHLEYCHIAGGGGTGQMIQVESGMVIRNCRIGNSSS